MNIKLDAMMTGFVHNRSSSRVQTQYTVEAGSKLAAEAFAAIVCVLVKLEQPVGVVLEPDMYPRYQNDTFTVVQTIELIREEDEEQAIDALIRAFAKVLVTQEARS